MPPHTTHTHFNIYWFDLIKTKKKINPKTKNAFLPPRRVMMKQSRKIFIVFMLKGGVSVRFANGGMS